MYSVPFSKMHFWYKQRGSEAFVSFVALVGIF